VNEGELDPWVAEWLEANPMELEPSEHPHISGMDFDMPITREIHRVTDDDIDGVPVRIYEHDGPPTALLVYFHGGGWCMGGIGLMDNVARELAHHTGAAVLSVGYRLAPAHPYPAGLDDCETVTRWAITNADQFRVSPDRVLVGGESAGGNLAAAVSLRLRDRGGPEPVGQVLIYPGTAGGDSGFPSRSAFIGLVVSEKSKRWFWESYTAGREELADDPYVAPLRADSLAGLPPALVILGGCDYLRDEGRAYAERMAAEGVDVESVLYPGQPHGFLNLGFPMAEQAYERIGAWVRERFGAG
jgi:acetyl esterase